MDTTSNTLRIDLSTVPDDITVNLFYEAGKANYTVEHWVQKLGSDDYELEKAISLAGDIDAYTEAVADYKEGFTSYVTQAPIAADGSTVIQIWYDRIDYTVVFDPNGGVNAPDPIYAEFGTAIDENYVTVPTRAGYIFKGWSPQIEYTVTKDVTYVAQWEPESENADYTVVIWGQNANNDDYSYLNSYPADGETGTEVSWNDRTLICGKEEHEHTAECYELVCDKEEHSHENCTLNCTHVHTLSCWGLDSNDRVDKPDDIREPQGGFVSGTVYTYETGFWGWKTTHHYLYFNGNWYCHHTGGWWGDPEKDDDTQITLANCPHRTHTDECYTCGKGAHTHTDNCYNLVCGKEAHTHTVSCYTASIAPDPNLWEFEKSDTVTIAADGSTVLNVYFTRKEFTLHFRRAYSSYDDYGTITARWGANIGDQFAAISKSAGTSLWSESRDAEDPWTGYLDIMPSENRTYYANRDSSGRSTATYYCEDLYGNYQMVFKLL